MKVAVVGSRNATVSHLENYLPPETVEIVSGGARGVDMCARAYARAHSLKLTEILPDYRRFGRGAPLKRNIEIVEYADVILAFWDGSSKGTEFVIKYCRKIGKKLEIFEVSALGQEKP